MIKYTVIIPHKNNAELVKRCILSIPDNEEIEVIVVDDNSSETNRTFVKRCCSERSNTKYIQCEESKGGGYARNIGLNHAIGEWIIFSDADDFFAKLFWEKIDTFVERRKADIIYFKVMGVYSTSLQPAKRGWNYNMYVSNYINGRKNSEERLRFYHMVPWGKVFKQSFIRDNGIKFDEVMASNDVMFNVIAGSLASNVVAYDYLMYYVTVSEYSLTKQINRDLLRTRFNVLIRHYKYVMSLGKPQCTFNLFYFVYKYSKPFGLSEYCRYIKLLWQERVNPFVIVRKIGRY